MLMKQLIFHVKNCRLTLIKRVKFPTVSKINKSHNTVHCLLESGATNASKMSYSQRVKEAKKKEAEARPDWDASTTGERKNISTEDKVAAKIAAEVLRDNAKLRAVHSGPSIKKLLEREAKKQMKLVETGGAYTGPVISTIVEKDKKDKNDPSNLPYLHKNPAV